MSYKVVNTIHIPGVDFGEKLLGPVGAELVNAPGKTEDEIIKHAADADAVICSGPVQPWTANVVGSLKKCRIIASLGVGYDRIDLETATANGIVVTNVPDYCIDEVSGQAIALMMVLGRRLIQIDRAVRKMRVNFVPMQRKNLAEFVFPVFRMRDQTVGVIGMGRIGTAVALKAKGLGMKVIAYDPHVFDSVIKSYGVRPVGFDTLLAESDFVSINSALNDETRNMIGYEELKKMKRTAYLINTARGEIVDQPGLIRGLREGLIAGAGLDVTEKEPIPENSPLLDMENVILTGHSAWYSATSDSGEFWQKATEQVVSALNGEWPIYAVNKEVRKKWTEKWGKGPESKDKKLLT